MAAAGLLALVGALVLVVVAVVARPELVALAILGVVGVLAGVVSGATTGRRRRIVALVPIALGVVALVIALVDPWSPERGVGLALGGALVLAVVAGRCIRQVRRPPPVPAEPARSGAVLFVNTRAGPSTWEPRELMAAADRLGVEVVELGPDDDLIERAETAVRDGARVLGMAGGDGSMGCVARVAARADLAFVCVPGGTRNHFALDIGLDRRDPAAALAAFGPDAHERRVDLAWVNDRPFVNNVTLGVYARVVSDPGYRDAKVGTFLTVLADLADRDEGLEPLRFAGPDGEEIEEASLVIVSNNPYRRHGLTGGMRRDRLDGGELGVIVMSDHSAGAVAATAVATAITTGEAADPVTAWSTPELSMDAAVESVDVAVDGEALSLTPPLRFRIDPGALRLRVPAGTEVGIDEQGDPGFRGSLEALLATVLGSDEDEPR